MSDWHFHFVDKRRTCRGKPGRLASQFRSLVEDAHYHAHRRGWHPWRQYQVVADLVRGGWRGPKPSAEAMGL